MPAHGFSAALRKRKEKFDRIGCKSSALVSTSERKLNDRYVMVDTQWSMRFHPRQGRPDEVIVGSTFILDTGGSEVKVVLYMPHRNVLVELGDPEPESKAP